MASSSKSLDHKDSKNMANNKFKEPEVVLGLATYNASDIDLVDTDDMCIGRKNKGVAWAYCMDQGGRKHMEDRVAAHVDFMKLKCDKFGGCTAPKSELALVESPIHYFAVFDGHGGAKVSDYCAEALHKEVKKAWRTEGCTHEWDKKWQSAISRAYDRVNEACEKDLSGGSTAVVVLLSTCQIVAANCGDSRAILCRGSYTIPLTVDHKPDREDEEVRITNSGGRVIRDSHGIMRVNGILAMSRALGDKQLKPSVSSVPELTFITRTHEDECLIIASDGLWDVLPTEVVGDIACRMLQYARKVQRIDQTPTQYVADYIFREARARSSTDNFSVIVIDLKPTATQ